MSELNSISKLPINIFTLNHDDLLENWMLKNSIEFTDGFEIESFNDFKLWKPNLFNKRKIKFLKLHGSLNWHVLFDAKNSRTIGYAKFLQYPDGRDITLKNGIATSYWDPPIFLTGYNNKYLSYNYGVYLQLFYHFQRLLYRTNLLIITGYSFSDNGINLRIIDWFVSDIKRKMIIITPNIKSLIDNARGPMQLRLSDFPRERLLFIEKGIQNFTISDIEHFL